MREIYVLIIGTFGAPLTIDRSSANSETAMWASSPGAAIPRSNSLAGCRAITGAFSSPSPARLKYLRRTRRRRKKRPGSYQLLADLPPRFRARLDAIRINDFFDHRKMIRDARTAGLVPARRFSAPLSVSLASGPGSWPPLNPLDPRGRYEADVNGSKKRIYQPPSRPRPGKDIAEATWKFHKSRMMPRGRM